MDGIYQSWNTNKALLTKAGKMGFIVSLNNPMSRETFHFPHNQLTVANHFNDDGVDYHSHNIRIGQTMNHANLSLQTVKFNTTKCTVKSRSSSAFAACRGVFSYTFGVGVRKRHPSILDIDNSAANPSNLQNADTINIVDMDLDNNDENDMDDWFDNDAVGTKQYTTPNRNLIQWVYVSRLRECRKTMKCFALVVGSCNAKLLTEKEPSFEMIGVRHQWISSQSVYTWELIKSCGK